MGGVRAGSKSVNRVRAATSRRRGVWGVLGDALPAGEARLPPLASPVVRWNVKSEKLMSYAVTYRDDDGSSDTVTGDPFIDGILRRYSRTL